MRMPRIKEDGEAYYHVISRIVDRQWVLKNDEKERFRRLMRATEGFSGVVVVDYAILDNHFHLVLWVPPARELSDEELLERLRYLYKDAEVAEIAEELVGFREKGDEAGARRLRDRYTCRMYDLSEFAKTLKQRFTQSYNRRHNRKGTLWEERFKSLVLEGRGYVLATVAAYVDLNAVRAGVVRDPKDYRFCGYGEAMGGSKKAREGIGHLMRHFGRDGNWAQVSAAYREYLYERGVERGVDEHGCALRNGFSREAAEQVRKVHGQLSHAALLRCRVRYFTDGVVLGSRGYVDELFGRYRNRFSPKRTSGARPMVGGAWGELYTARRLRLSVIGQPVQG